MADFELAVAKTIKNEGSDAYTETEGDKGGATKYGISSRLLSDILYQEHSNDADYDHNDEFIYRRIKNLDLNTAKSIYKKYFWDANRYGEIEDQAIAEKVFDMAVLIGAPKVNKIIQEYFNSIYNEYNQLKVDGIFGEKTLDMINDFIMDGGMSRVHLMQAIKLYCAKYCIDLCNKNKSQSKFLLGWLNRVML